MIQKDGKTYYNFDEARKISDAHIREDAKDFAKRVIQKQKEMQNV
jgi:hypothetical protein